MCNISGHGMKQKGFLSATIGLLISSMNKGSTRTITSNYDANFVQTNQEVTEFEIFDFAIKTCKKMKELGILSLM